MGTNTDFCVAIETNVTRPESDPRLGQQICWVQADLSLVAVNMVLEKVT